MKKLLLVLLLSAFSLQAADIDFLFDYVYVTPGCVDAASVDCIDSFEVRDEKDGAVVAIATATPGANTPAVDIPAFATNYAKLGNRTFAAYAVGRTDTGARIESLKSNDATAVIRPDAATNNRANQN